MRLLIVIIALALTCVGCREKKEPLNVQETDPELVEEIKEIDSTISALDSLNKEIKASSDKLDELVKDLNE